MLETLKDTFNLFYLPVFGNEYHFSNKKVEGSLKTFLSHIPSGAGEDWLFSFTLFQFAYYDGMKTRFNRIYVNWIYGDKALKRWEERTEAQVYYANQYKIKLGISRPLQVLPANEYKDKERIRFKPDMHKQLMHCHMLSLFNGNSAACQDCIHNSVCS